MGSQLARSPIFGPRRSVGEGAKIGNFVELKKTTLGPGSKVNHLSYLGDATVGAGVNVGAGTITCNYDGVKKHQTVIEDGAFIGSDTQLIAPVDVGKGAYVGAGSSITEDVPAGSLGIARGRQTNIEGWVERKKKRPESRAEAPSEERASVMCGIIGYIGSKPVVPVLLDGLRRMEYRGYDSAGVALVSPEGISLRRSAGKLVNLENAIRIEPVDGVYGVGHTRWATHGRPTEENAHPHRDCTGTHRRRPQRHHRELSRAEAASCRRRGTSSRPKPTRRSSRTSSSARCATTASRTRSAARCIYMRGMFAIVLVSVDDPEKIVAVRNGPPIVVGLGEDEFFVASDIPAILATPATSCSSATRRWRSSRGRASQFTDYSGREVSKTTQRVMWDPIAAEKGGHKHFMLKEIFEQPTAARDTILGRVSLEQGRDLSSRTCNISEETFASLQKVTIIACGTSWHAGLVGKYLIEALAQVPVEVDYGSEYRYRNPIISNNELAIVITQSGETADTLRRAARGQAKGASSIAICNVVGSMATREADGTVYTHAGPEIGVASTKAFTSQLVALQLLALYMAQVRGTLRPNEIRRHIDELLQLPQIIEQAVKASAAMDKVAERFYNRTGLPVPRPRHQLPDRARGRAEAEGDLLHPRRGVSGRRDEARANRAHRRADAGRGDRARTITSSRR